MLQSGLVNVSGNIMITFCKYSRDSLMGLKQKWSLFEVVVIVKEGRGRILPYNDLVPTMVRLVSCNAHTKIVH